MKFEDGYRLSEEEIRDLGPVVEAGPSIVVPERGGRKRDVFTWDGQAQEGTVKLAVIRPCVSRGKRIRGLPPIYTQEMLAENASVYTGWLMYMDHLSGKVREALEEILQEAPGRSVSELGGRVLRSWYDPGYTAGWDADRGYHQGAVLAEALPQPGARAMLEADPEILNVSHNAFPKGAVVGTHWGQKGAIIEGIRKEPEGSVDWVPRGGAGGQLAEADEALAVSVLRGHYDARPVSKLGKEIKDRTSLLEALREEAPQLLEEIGGEDALKPPVPAPTPAVGTALTADQLKEALDERDQQWETKLDEQRASAESEAERIIRERAESSKLASYAHELIEGAGLPKDWEGDLKRRYAVLPSGPSPAIQLAESAADGEDDDEKDEKYFIKESIVNDLKHAQRLIEASGGTVRVKGLAPAEPDPDGEGGGQKVEERQSEWIEGIGGVRVEEGQKESDLISGMLSEGVRP